MLPVFMADTRLFQRISEPIMRLEALLFKLLQLMPIVCMLDELDNFDVGRPATSSYKFGFIQYPTKSFPFPKNRTVPYFPWP